MMEPLNIWDEHIGLSHVLVTLPDRAQATVWMVEDFIEQDGEPYFEINSSGDDPLSKAKAAGKRLSHADFIKAAAETRQVIWGTFKAYDDRSGPNAWLSISAVDSTFWEIVTDDLDARRSICTGFGDVRKGKM